MQYTPSLLFRRAVKEHWPMYALGCVTMLITSTSEVLVPKFVQWGLDFLAAQGQMSILPPFLRAPDPQSSLNRLVVFLLVVLLVGFLGRIGWRQTFGRRTHDAGYELKNQFWNSLRFQPMFFFHRYPLGDLMNRAIGDWNKVRFIHGFTLVTTFDVIYFVILAVASMLWINVPLTLLCLAMVPFLPRPISRLARREGEQHIVAQEKLSTLSDLISQSISTVRLQRATASDSIWQSNLKKEAEDYAEKNFAVLRTGWKIFPLGALPTLAAYIVLLSFGVHKIVQGQLSIGEFVAMQSYVLLLQGPLFELAQVFAEWQTGFGSFHRLVEIFNDGEKANEKAGSKLKVAVGEEAASILSVRNVSYSYPHVLTPVLKNVTFDIRKGEKVGITGPIGAGKSTLLKAACGLLEPSEGEIRLFGASVAEMNQSWLSQKVVMVQQKAFLFSGTITYNLSLDGKFPEEKLWEVLEIVQLADDVRHFSDGLNTWIGEWGITLSGGQKQRLALARALLRPTPLLLLDDCLSAVDAITEERILEALERKLTGQTIIWVAHRVSTLKLCDRVYKLDHGMVQEWKD